MSCQEDRHSGAITTSGKLWKQQKYPEKTEKKFLTGSGRSGKVNELSKRQEP